jgi:hypothetical protein
MRTFVTVRFRRCRDSVRDYRRSNETSDGAGDRPTAHLAGNELAAAASNLATGQAAGGLRQVSCAVCRSEFVRSCAPQVRLAFLCRNRVRDRSAQVCHRANAGVRPQIPRRRGVSRVVDSARAHQARNRRPALREGARKRGELLMKDREGALGHPGARPEARRRDHPRTRSLAPWRSVLTATSASQQD